MAPIRAFTAPGLLSIAPVLDFNAQEEPLLLHDELTTMAWVEAHVLLTAMKFHFLISSHTVGKALPSAQASFKLCFLFGLWPLQKWSNQKILQYSLVWP
jgi:hypothetical protein